MILLFLVLAVEANSESAELYCRLAKECWQERADEYKSCMKQAKSERDRDECLTGATEHGNQCMHYGRLCKGFTSLESNH